MHDVWKKRPTHIRDNRRHLDTPILDLSRRSRHHIFDNTTSAQKCYNYIVSMLTTIMLAIVM